MRRTVRRARLLAPVLALGLLLAGCTEQGVEVSSQTVGGVDYEQWQKPTTEPVTFSGKQTDGGTFRSSAHLGDVVVVNFWYAQCAPCRVEAPDLEALSKQFAGDGVQFVGVNISDDAAYAAQFEKEFGLTYPNIVDQADGASVQLAFAGARPPKAVPTTLVLDRKGRVTARIVSRADKSILRQLIQDAVDGQAS